MQFMSVYLNFAGTTEEAFDFYRSVFGGDFTGQMRFRDFGDDMMGVSEADADKIAHVSLPLVGDIALMGSDVVGPAAAGFKAGTNVYVYLEAESAEEAERVFSALSDGGRMEMPMQPVQWAEKYGTCIDRFGTPWMVSYTGDVQFSM